MLCLECFQSDYYVRYVLFLRTILKHIKLKGSLNIAKKYSIIVDGFDA